jgi:hypothetical protein
VLGGMARKIRLEYAEAFYHVINRGNYRRDLVAVMGATEAFQRRQFKTVVLKTATSVSNTWLAKRLQM